MDAPDAPKKDPPKNHQEHAAGLLDTWYLVGVNPKINGAGVQFNDVTTAHAPFPSLLGCQKVGRTQQAEPQEEPVHQGRQGQPQAH